MIASCEKCRKLFDDGVINDDIDLPDVLCDKCFELMLVHISLNPQGINHDH